MKYEGKFVVIDKDKLSGTRPKQGQIILYKTRKGDPSGQMVLRCPFCGALQFCAGQVEGNNDTPTVKRPITCGCKQRCGNTFRIRSGEVHPEQSPSGHAPSPPLSENMVEHGVHYQSKKNPQR